MILSILLLIVLIYINGVFSASELAFLSLDKIKLKEEIRNGNSKAIKINKMVKSKSSFLSTIQIGITLAGFLASAFAADYFADYFIKIIKIDFISQNIIRSILVVIITIILSYFTLIFGELVPKKIAMNDPYKIASKYIALIEIVNIIFNPLIKLLTLSTEIICKVLKIKEKDNKTTEEDIKKMILLGETEGAIEEKEKEYILNIFKFNDIKATEVMTKKENVTLINIEEDKKDIILKIKNHKFTRYPVYKENMNNIIGILNVKDLILNYHKDKQLEIKEILRPYKKINSDELIDDIFKKMQEENESICLVYEKEDFVGIITIEDAIEEIVGNIYDEYDKVK